MNIEKANLSQHARIITQFQIAMALETENLKLNTSVVELGVKAIFENNHKGEYYICVDEIISANNKEQKIIASLLVIPEWSDWRNATVLWIHSVYVVPEYRGKGVFKLMYNYLKEKVVQTPAYCGLRLYVDQKNTSAQKVYERMGMNSNHYKLYEWLVE